MSLALLVPTRGRPDNLRRFIRAVGATAEGDWHIYVRFDDDDPALPDYEDVLDTCGYDGLVSAYFGERIGFAASLNELAYQAASFAGTRYLGMFGDDVVPVILGWDVSLTEALGDRLGVAYGDDGLRDKHARDLPTHYITQTEVYRRLGYLAPPGIRHLYLDNVARDIGRYLGHFVYVPVLIRHAHPWAEGEHLDDKTYEEGGRNPAVRKRDRVVYMKWARDASWRRSLRP